MESSDSGNFIRPNSTSAIRTRIGRFVSLLQRLQDTITDALEIGDVATDEDATILAKMQEELDATLGSVGDVQSDMYRILEQTKLTMEGKIGDLDDGDPKDNMLIKRGNELAACRAKIIDLETDNQDLRRQVKELKRYKETTDARRDQVVFHLRQDLERAQNANAKLQQTLSAESRKQQALQTALEQEYMSRGSPGPSGGSTRRSVSASGYSSTRGSKGGHLDVISTINRNQSLINELSEKRVENVRLRRDNTDLVSKTKEAIKGVGVLRAQVSTSVADRAELLRRLETSKQEADLWKQQLQKTAETLIRRHQLERAHDEERRWQRIEDINSGNSRSNLSSPGGLSKTRNIQVQNWGSFVGGRANTMGRYGDGYY